MMKKLCALLLAPFLWGCETIETEPVQTEVEALTWEMVETATENYALSYPRFLAGPESIVAYLNNDLPTGAESFVRQAEVREEGQDIAWILSIEPGYQYNSPEFTSLQLNTYDYTGGANGNAYYGVLNYDNFIEKFITLSDLFEDDRYLEPLADFIDSEITLLKADRDADYDRVADSMLEEGVQPLVKNFRTFVFEDGPEGRGLKFLFAPHQLGASATGSFEILVPVGILSDFVKPKYQPWFSPVPVDMADYVGLEFEQAFALAASRNVPLRKVMEDGMPLAVTEDWRPGRINASVENGVVVSYRIEGN